MPEFTVNPEDIMVKFIALSDRIILGMGKVTEKETDSFRKIVIVNGKTKPWKNDEGFIKMLICVACGNDMYKDMLTVKGGFR